MVFTFRISSVLNGFLVIAKSSFELSIVSYNIFMLYKYYIRSDLKTSFIENFLFLLAKISSDYKKLLTHYMTNFCCLSSSHVVFIFCSLFFLVHISWVFINRQMVVYDREVVESSYHILSNRLRNLYH